MSLLFTSFASSAQTIAEGLADGTLKLPPPPATLDLPWIGPQVRALWAEAATDFYPMLERLRPHVVDYGTVLLGLAATAGLSLLEFIVAMIIAGVLLPNAVVIHGALHAFVDRLTPHRGKAFVELAGATVRNVARGVVGIAMLQGLLLGLGFLAVGIPFAGLWTVLAIVLGIVQIGPGLIVLGTLVYAWASFDVTTALLFTVWTVPVALLDNVLKPILMARGLPVPMIVIFIGVLGGTLLHGLVGLFVGPVILAFGYVLLRGWMMAGAVGRGHASLSAPRAMQGDSVHRGRHGLATWMPGLAQLLRYEPRWLGRDLAAGLSVAAIALPVGIAYSDLTGVPTNFGIYAAIFPLLAYALFGSSRQLIIGPDAATCLLLAASLGPLAGGDGQRYLALLVPLTLMTGTIYLLAGWARLGFIASFLSQPILTGYLNGIALVIIAGQLPKLLGYPSAGGETLAKLIEVVQRAGQSHVATATVGLALVGVLLVLRWLLPRLPAPLLAILIGIAAAVYLDLGERGVALTGEVPAGLPQPSWTWFDLATYRSLFADACGIVLISFAGGVLTAKSFARRNGYDIDANQELVALGAANLVAGVTQGFTVTGANSRTAVNDAVGGRSQLVGIVAAGAMLLVLFFLTWPLALVPTTALAAVVLVSALGLFDLAGLRLLFSMNWREGLISVATTLGVVVLGVLQGVVLAVALSLFWLLATAMRPRDAVLGKLPDKQGFHSLADFPEAATVPGLLLYRFNANIVFFNADYFCARIRRVVARARQPVQWLVIDMSPVNAIDVTAVQRMMELQHELAAQGIVLALAHARRHLTGSFGRGWIDARRSSETAPRLFPSLRAAVKAYEQEVAAKPD